MLPPYCKHAALQVKVPDAANVQVSVVLLTAQYASWPFVPEHTGRQPVGTVVVQVSAALEVQP